MAKLGDRFNPSTYLDKENYAAFPPDVANVGDNKLPLSPTYHTVESKIKVRESELGKLISLLTSNGTIESLSISPKQPPTDHGFIYDPIHGDRNNARTVNLNDYDSSH